MLSPVLPRHSARPPEATAPTFSSSIQTFSLLDNTLTINGKVYKSTKPLAYGEWEIGASVEVENLENGMIKIQRLDTYAEAFFTLIEPKKNSVVWKGVVVSSQNPDRKIFEILAKGMTFDGVHQTKTFTIKTDKFREPSVRSTIELVQEGNLMVIKTDGMRYRIANSS